jgi:hypothetical protein
MYALGFYFSLLVAYALCNSMKKRRVECKLREREREGKSHFWLISIRSCALQFVSLLHAYILINALFIMYTVFVSLRLCKLDLQCVHSMAMCAALLLFCHKKKEKKSFLNYKLLMSFFFLIHKQQLFEEKCFELL